MRDPPSAVRQYRQLCSVHGDGYIDLVLSSDLLSFLHKVVKVLNNAINVI